MTDWQTMDSGTPHSRELHGFKTVSSEAAPKHRVLAVNHDFFGRLDYVEIEITEPTDE